MKYLLTIIFCFLFLNLFSQTFTYSGNIYTANGSAINVPVKLYKRTTPNLIGFTSQTNYNGHSYYRSTGTANWAQAQQACANMGGHLVTISNSAENNFVYNTWPSGWIGYYQDKTGAFYGEPNGGWRWTETPITSNQLIWYNISNVTNDTTTSPGYSLETSMRVFNSVSYSGTGNTIIDVSGNSNGTIYNSPSYTSSGGKYFTFNGTNQYIMTTEFSSLIPGSIGSKSPNQTIMMWVYPTGNGVILDELSSPSTSSGWHESVFEITGGNTLNVGFWNGSGISKVTTNITLNKWHCIGVTYDGTTMRGYLNGNNFDSINFNRHAPYNYSNGIAYAIGLADVTNMGSGLAGSFRLGDFQVFNTNLTTDEMNRNYMASAWRYGVYPFSNWNGGEPNNSGGEDFIQFVSSGRWNDLPNRHSLNYVLEFDTVVTYTPWTLATTVYTNSSGNWSISYPTNPSLEFYIQIEAPTTPNILPNINDALSCDSVVVKLIKTNGLHYYQYDINGDDEITISDVYYIINRYSNQFKPWLGKFTTPKLFTSIQFNIIKSSTSDLRLTYTGVSNITINNPISGSSINHYLLVPGYRGNVTF